MSTIQNFGVPTGVGEGRGGMLMPKVKYKFRLIFTNFGIPSGSIAMTQQVISCDRPNVAFSPVEMHAYNSIDWYAGKASWEAVNVTVRDDVTNSCSQLVGAQLQKQMNFFAQTSPLAGTNYKFDMIMQTMDGSDDGVLEEWDLEGCLLASANYESFDYGSSDALTIALSIRFANATQTAGLMPALPILSNLGSGLVS